MYLKIKEPTKQISADSVRVWRLSNLLGYGIALCIAGVFLFAANYYDWKTWIFTILTIITVLLLALAVWSVGIEPIYLQKTWRYEIDEQFAQLKYGRFTVKHIVIPMEKVEYVSTNQGPFLRKYGLYNVEIGTTTSDHTIPAIHHDEAYALREQIAIYAKVKLDGENGVEEA
ncbi:PH domain-containing protein [Gracilibacillus sp. Marseille-QA3620]